MRGKWKALYDAIADKLEELGFTPDSPDRYTFRGRLLYARIVDKAESVLLLNNEKDRCVIERHLEVHFAERRTFDRWANSTNFAVHFVLDDVRDKRDRLAAAVKQARAICRAKIFNFNQHFHTIELG